MIPKHLSRTTLLPRWNRVLISTLIATTSLFACARKTAGGNTFPAQTSEAR